MHCLRQPDDSDYDVLGVSPEATGEEIDSAFRRLIYGQGYKVGVPVRSQFARAREIKAAYATLGDPVKRRAYDESLSRASDPTPWAATANDAATDNLVLPRTDPEAEPVEIGSTPNAVVPRDPDEFALTGSEPERALDRAQTPDAEEIISLHNRPPPPYLAPIRDDDERYSAPTLNDNKRVSVRAWGMATAVTFALWLVFLSSWPGWNRLLSTGDRPPKITARAGQASDGGPSLRHYSAQAPSNFNGAAASDPADQGALPPDSPAAPVAISRPFEPQRASDERTTHDVGVLATRDTADAQSHPDTTPGGTTPAAAGESIEAAEAPATRPAPTPPVARTPAIATAPPPARVAPAIVGASVGAASSGRLVRGPQWVGGGPTDADNLRGRYQGTVAVKVTVEPGGRVSNCVPVRGSGNAGLDAMTCRLVQERARFTPALDAQGRPVASQAYTTFVWGRRRRQ